MSILHLCYHVVTPPPNRLFELLVVGVLCTFINSSNMSSLKPFYSYDKRNPYMKRVSESEGARIILSNAISAGDAPPFHCDSVPMWRLEKYNDLAIKHGLSSPGDETYLSLRWLNSREGTLFILLAIRTGPTSSLSATFCSSTRSARSGQPEWKRYSPDKRHMSATALIIFNNSSNCWLTRKWSCATASQCPSKCLFSLLMVWNITSKCLLKTQMMTIGPNVETTNN